MGTAQARSGCSMIENPRLGLRSRPHIDRGGNLERERHNFGQLGREPKFGRSSLGDWEPTFLEMA